MPKEFKELSDKMSPEAQKKVMDRKKELEAEETKTLKDWKIENPEEVAEEVEGAFSKEMIIKIAKGGIVTLSIGGKPIGLITELNFEAAVVGEIGNVKKFEVTQAKLVPSDKEGFWEEGERSFLTMEEFITAQEKVKGSKNLEGE